MARSLRAVLTLSLVAGALVAGPAVVSGPVVAAAPAVEPSTSTFTPRSPLRVLDTRVTGTPVGAGGTVTIDFSNRVPATVTAVVLNVTGISPTLSTVVTAYPGGTSRPTASSLNLSAGEIRANQVTVALGADRSVRLHNNSGRIDLVADLAGHYGTGTGSLFTVLPANPVLGTTRLGPGGSLVLDLRAAVPTSATAVTFNLTASRATTSTFAIAWPTGTTRPTASNLNLVPGETRSNLVTVALGADRTVTLYNKNGYVDLLADLTGFYSPEFGAGFMPLAPTRVLDTRVGTGVSGAIGQEAQIELAVDRYVPVNATGVIMNVTGVGATTSTSVTAWGQGLFPQSGSATVNLVPTKAVPNAAVVPFSRVRGVGFHNRSGSTHLVADLSGVFVVPPAACAPGCVKSWGYNLGRKLGTGQTVSSTDVPTPVAGLSGVRQVTSGGSNYTTYAVLADGTVRAWGDNGAGQLGNGWMGTDVGAGYGSAVPVPVRGLTGVTAVAATASSAFALRSDGTVWAWGSGLLGTGAYVEATVPVRLPDLTDVVAIEAGDSTVYALRSDGTVWSWGDNSSGSLGTGTTDDHAYAPVRLPTITDVVSVGAGDSNGYAVRADGTVWAWGANGAGQLGNGQDCDPDNPAQCASAVPVQVTGLTGVSAIAAGHDTAYAVRTDGTVAAWGSSHRGKLGDGVPCDDYTTCVVRTPVAVTGLTGVTAVASFSFGGYALRADGTVWSWGGTTNDALGNDSIVDYTATPVPVLGVSGASAVGSGYWTGYVVIANP